MLPRLLYASAVFNTDFAQIRHTSRGFSERFLSHTDLTDTNRLIYSADAAVLTTRISTRFLTRIGTTYAPGRNLLDNLIG